VSAQAHKAVSKEVESPVKGIIDGSCQRTLDRNLDAVAILSKYAANSFSLYASPEEGSSGSLSPETEIEVLLPLVLRRLKKDIVQSQITYQTLYLQGLTPFQWFLLSKEIPSNNTFTFHRTLQHFEELFLLPPVKAILGALNFAFLDLDKTAICRELSLVNSFFDEKRGRSMSPTLQLQIKSAVDSVIDSCSKKADLYLNGSGTSYNRMAVFFAIVADSLWHAREAKGDNAALGQLLGLMADLRLLNLSLAQCVTQDGKAVPDGRIEDFLERSVREVLIYNTRLFSNGFVSKRIPGIKAGSADGKFLIRQLEIVQSRLLQIQSIQRRALRAISEIKRIDEQNPRLKGSPYWMFGDLRSHLRELHRELNICIYGEASDEVSPGSVEGLLFSPVMKAELMSLISLVPDCSSFGGGVVSARDEVFRLLSRIKSDHSSIIVPFFKERDQLEKAKLELFSTGQYVTPSVTDEEFFQRVSVVSPMLSSGRTEPGSLLSPGQMDSLRIEDIMLWKTVGIPSVSVDMVTTTPAGSKEYISEDFLKSLHQKAVDSATKNNL
jgi:hypothetical protein